MKTNLFIICCCVVISVHFSCSENDPPYLEGDIKGSVLAIDSYGYELQDRSGIRVQLSNETVFMEDLTDDEGFYVFDNVPYGNYDLNLIKDNYIERKLDFQLGHVGGDVPTITSQIISEKPEFWFSIDSINYDGAHRLKINFQVLGAEMPFSGRTSHFVHCFFSQSPDVSAENYEDSFIEYAGTYLLDDSNEITWIWWDGWYNFLKDYSGTVYCRMYPQVNCEEIWFPNTSEPHDVLLETLGKPSEVFTFTLD